MSPKMSPLFGKKYFFNKKMFFLNKCSCRNLLIWGACWLLNVLVKTFNCDPESHPTAFELNISIFLYLWIFLVKLVSLIRTCSRTFVKFKIRRALPRGHSIDLRYWYWFLRYYSLVAALQYLLPSILMIFLSLLYKSASGLTWYGLPNEPWKNPAGMENLEEGTWKVLFKESWWFFTY